MIVLWRMLLRVFGRRPPDSPRDPAVKAAAAESREQVKDTYQLLGELRSQTRDMPRLERARLRYEERRYGTHRPT